MKFYNREKELEILDSTTKLSSGVGAQFIVISGRRRIGKSELIRQAFKKHKYLYFFVSKKRSSNLLKEFNDQFNLFRDDRAEYTDWDSFIEALLTYCTEKRIVLIFDEFQEFSNLEEPIYSIFQKHWEHFQKKRGLIIVVAGSLISLIETIFYSSKEPLYGRATRKIVLREFDFATVRQILTDERRKTNKQRKNVDLRELLSFYAVFGGNPHYYNQIEKENLFKEDIFKIIDLLVLGNYSSLHNEGREILISEFGSEHATYFSILESISKGCDSFSKIESYTQLDSGFLSRSLKILEGNFKLIRKEVPIFPNNRKIIRYRIVNSFMYFWFRYIYANQSKLGLDTSKLVLRKIKKELDSIVGHVFESYCAQYLLDVSAEGDFDFAIKDIGRWWDKHGEVDLVIEGDGNKIAFVECKLSQAGINKKQIANFLGVTARIDAVKYREKQYYFMVGGDVNKEKRQLLEVNNIKLIKLK